MSDRRKFIKNVAGATALACCGSSLTLLMQSCTTVYKIQAPIIDHKMSVSKSDFMDADFIVITNDELKAPVYLAKENNNYRAFLMLCTHRQCTLTPTGTFMTCPCHGSEFSSKGEVLAGPANEPLIEYTVVDSETTLTIELNNPITS